MVNLTNNYPFIVTNKNAVTSDSHFNLFFGYGNWSPFTVQIIRIGVKLVTMLIFRI